MREKQDGGRRVMERQKRKIIKTTSHIYLSPDILLQPYVAHYTIMPPKQGNIEALATVPDASGCIVFEATKYGLKAAQVWGPTTQTRVVTDSRFEEKGDVSWLIFIEFRQCGLFGLTGIPADSIKDSVFILSSILPHWEIAFQHAFEKTASWDELFNRLDIVLLTLQRECNIWGISSGVLQTVRQTNGAISVKVLSDEFTYSPRHMNRLLSMSLGLSIKSYIKLLRINLALTQIKEKGSTLTEISQRLGYYDQPHFIHDFKEICGVTPTEYQAQMSDFYNEIYKF